MPRWNAEWKINFLRVFLKINHLGLNSFLTLKNYPIFVKINSLLSSCPSADTTYSKQGISFSALLTNHFYPNVRGSVGAVLGKSDGERAHSHWGLWGKFDGNLVSAWVRVTSSLCTLRRRNLMMGEREWSGSWSKYLLAAGTQWLNPVKG